MREFWTDDKGKEWPVVESTNALKFRIPSHAALRRFIFKRDGYRCIQCGASAVDVPENYDGVRTLYTTTVTGGGFQDVLILDHVLTRRAGGRNIVENLQTLCETCNKKKLRHDKQMTEQYRRGKHD